MENGQHDATANTGPTPLCSPLNDALASRLSDTQDQEESLSGTNNVFIRKIQSRLTKFCTWSMFRALLLGQLLSLLIAGTAVTSQMLHSDYNVVAPTAQSFLNYVLLCIIFTTILATRPGDKGLPSILRKRGWKYFLVAVCDVEANYLMVKAYQYTTLTSVQLLDCFTIPVVLVLSFLVLKTRYQLLHFVSVGVCLMGVSSLVWADLITGRPQGGEGTNHVLGDVLCLAAAALYGVSNVAEEYVVRHFCVVEFLGMIGLFGCIINGVQLSILERQEVSVIDWTRWEVVALLMGFALCLLLLYVLMPVVIKATSATVVNLSIMSADIYSLFAGLFIFNYHFNGLYFLSFALILFGILLYTIQPTKQAVDSSPSYRVMIEDAAPAEQGLEMAVNGS